MANFWFSPRKCERLRQSWLGAPIERYVEWLVEHRYSRESIDDRVPVLIHFGEFTYARGVRRFEELPAHVGAFVEDWVARTSRRGPRACRSSAQKARGCVEQMLRLTVEGFQGGRLPTRP